MVTVVCLCEMCSVCGQSCECMRFLQRGVRVMIGVCVRCVHHGVCVVTAVCLCELCELWSVFGECCVSV